MIIAVMSLSFTGCGSKGETETEMSTVAVTETAVESATETEVVSVETTEELTSESAEADEENDKPQISYIAIEEKAKGEERIREAEERAEAERQAAEAEQTTETQATQAKTTEAQTAQAQATEAPANVANSNSNNNAETHGDGYNIPGPVSNIFSSGRTIVWTGYEYDENGNAIPESYIYHDQYGYVYNYDGSYDGWNIYDY